MLAASAGRAGRWIHYGLTSSDVVDTGLALQIKAVGGADPARRRGRSWTSWPPRRASTCTRCAPAARTASTPSRRRFGIKLAGFAFEAQRNVERLERAFAQAAVGALSGAVGTYSATSPEFERRVVARLGL